MSPVSPGKCRLRRSSSHSKPPVARTTPLRARIARVRLPARAAMRPQRPAQHRADDELAIGEDLRQGRAANAIAPAPGEIAAERPRADHAAAELAANRLGIKIGMVDELEFERRVRFDEFEHLGRLLDEGLPERVLLLVPPRRRGGAQIAQRFVPRITQPRRQHVMVGGNPRSRPRHRRRAAEHRRLLENDDTGAANRGGKCRRQRRRARADDDDVGLAVPGSEFPHLVRGSSKLSLLRRHEPRGVRRGLGPNQRTRRYLIAAVIVATADFLDSSGGGGRVSSWRRSRTR